MNKYLRYKRRGSAAVTEGDVQRWMGQLQYASATGDMKGMLEAQKKIDAHILGVQDQSLKDIEAAVEAEEKPKVVQKKPKQAAELEPVFWKQHKGSIFLAAALTALSGAAYVIVKRRKGSGNNQTWDLELVISSPWRGNNAAEAEKKLQKDQKWFQKMATAKSDSDWSNNRAPDWTIVSGGISKCSALGMGAARHGETLTSDARWYASGYPIFRLELIAKARFVGTLAQAKTQLAEASVWLHNLTVSSPGWAGPFPPNYIVEAEGKIYQQPGRQPVSLSAQPMEQQFANWPKEKFPWSVYGRWEDAAWDKSNKSVYTYDSMGETLAFAEDLGWVDKYPDASMASYDGPTADEIEQEALEFIKSKGYIIKGYE